MDIQRDPASVHDSSHSRNHSEDQVDVSRATGAFHELERKLTRRSQADKSASSTLQEDVESARQKEPFNLREYLSSSNDEYQKAGIKHKHVGVTWEDLEVEVPDGLNVKVYIPTFADAIVAYFMAPLLFIWGYIANFLHIKKETHLRTILHKSSGALKPGEMCLVLGCPGSGCSTFLKAIANDRSGFVRVGGDVQYAGMDAAEMGKYYKGEVVYNQEDDIHAATLTVGQTLAFALSLKAPGPGGRLPGTSSTEFQSEVEDTLLRMLNISHTRDTLVGDEFVRGVSGGERKRVSIAEMMATRARVQCWDNTTRGLDASTALDFAKCLRVMTDVLGQTTFVTLYQAGEGIYDLFDKILVLDEGRQVYYGPPSEARAYFEKLGYNSLPRQSTADYLTGCTDVNQRQFAKGRSREDVPSTSHDLESAFLASSFAKENRESLGGFKKLMETEKADQEIFRQAVIEDKKRGVSKKSPYTVGFLAQVRALTVRQFQMRMQDKFQLYSSFTLTTSIGLVIGAGFFQLPATADGAFPRTGLVFGGLLTVCMEAFGELPMTMMGRPVFNKQTGYSLYRPAAHVVANTLADLPFSALRVLIWDICIYFLGGLHRSAGAFFTYHFLNYFAFLTIQGLFRTLGLFCHNFDTAFRLITCCIPVFMQYSGYLIPVQIMQRWLFWIYYINPISYAYAGCLENEFKHLHLPCLGNSIVPRNVNGLTSYPDELGPNQSCTIFGAQPGSSIVEGSDYLKVGFDMDVADLWRRNFVILVVMMLFYQLTQVIIIEFLPQSGGGMPVAIFAKENAETKKLNEEQRRKKQAKLDKINGAISEKSSSQNLQINSNEKQSEEKQNFSDRKAFTWEGLNYDVPVPGGNRRLLNNVNGFVKPGTLTAVMGASGAGKTTCLDVLAQRKTIGIVTGEMLVDGAPLTSDFARGTAYAEQMDVHEGTATVREAMRFSAYLRQPAHVSKEEKDAYVEEMLELLELQDLSEALVLSLSVEARKRLTIGVELASKPELLLFLDEPTSGLDAQSAWNLVRFLRKLAGQGQAILCTIHQPSSLLFESFDRLLLLERGGETVYFGDIGSDSHIIREYFAHHGAACPANVNPAEYVLDAIGAGIAPRIGDKDWKDIWQASDEYAEVRKEIEDIKSRAHSRPKDNGKRLSTYATPFLTQLRIVVQRNSLSLWRNPDYVFSRLFVHATMSLFISLSYLQLGNSTRELQYRVFGIFWTCILPSVIMSQLEAIFVFNRRIFIRESSSRIYSPYVFALGQLIGEVPYSILCAFFYWVLMVYPMGFGNGHFGLNGTGFDFMILLFIEIFGVTTGQMFAAISPSVQVAVLWNPVLNGILTTFCGVVIPYPNMIHFWKSWLYELDPYTRSVAAFLSNELHGLPIQCKSDEFSVFDPPSGQTCGSWAGQFADKFGGYIDNLSDTAACRYCQFKVGDEFYEPLNISASNRWRDAFIFFAFAVFNVIITILASRYLRYAKR